jgi:FolB domain-containing protein
VRGNHGVFDFEKRDGQDFVIDVTLHTSVSAAAATDDLTETIHYGELAEDVAGIVETTPSTSSKPSPRPSPNTA